MLEDRYVVYCWIEGDNMWYPVGVDCWRYFVSTTYKMKKNNMIKIFHNLICETSDWFNYYLRTSKYTFPLICKMSFSTLCYSLNCFYVAIFFTGSFDNDNGTMRTNHCLYTRLLTEIPFRERWNLYCYNQRR